MIWADNIIMQPRGALCVVASYVVRGISL